jgi:UDP-N-acetylmuramate dehydrogenase
VLIETKEFYEPSNLPEILVLDNTGHMKKEYSKKFNWQDIEVRGVMKLNEPMKKHTSWRTGGHAERYFKPADVDDLCSYLKQVPEDEPLFWLGLGSNLLVRDGGLQGTVIALSGVLNDLHVYDDVSVHVGAGVACAKVARMSVKAGLSGGEFLAGIPGTMGGALAMNAGAFGGETWNIVRSVETVNRQGQRIKRDASEFETAYRYVNLPEDEWFISAELILASDEDANGLERIQALLNKREESQPTGKASCGSVFRNPENDYAARLIEVSGLKGQAIGNAQVSEKHANFIINSGSASAEDIESLILLIQEKVKLDHGIELNPEVRIVGDYKKV